MHVDVAGDKPLAKKRSMHKVVAINLGPGVDNGGNDKTLSSYLQQRGFVTWHCDPDAKLEQTLSKLKSSDLLVTGATAEFWYARAVDCPVLLVTDDIDPGMMMPDYAPPTGAKLPDAGSLAQSIASIFES